MKKIVLILAIVLSLALVLVACGDPGYENGNGVGIVTDPVYDLNPDLDLDPDFDFDFDLDTPGFGGDDWVNPDGNPDEALVALVNELYEGVDIEFNTLEVELTAANFSQFVFIDYIEGTTGVVSQAMISAIPHAVVLLELPEGADASAVAAEIEAEADPARWICVAAEKADVFYSGNFIVFAMATADVVDGIGANVSAVLA